MVLLSTGRSLTSVEERWISFDSNKNQQLITSRKANSMVKARLKSRAELRDFVIGCKYMD